MNEYSREDNVKVSSFVRLINVLVLVSLITISNGVSSELVFDSSVNYGVGSNPESVFSAYFDGDGDNDLAVANFTSNSVSALKNRGDGKFSARVDYLVGYGPACVFSIDLDNDGDSDLAVAKGLSGYVCILMNNGNGTFARAIDYTSGAKPVSVILGDFNGDGNQDVSDLSGPTSMVAFMFLGGPPPVCGPE